jgi:hypothetical protein
MIGAINLGEACAPHHWGSSFELINKKQKKEAQRRV